MRRLDLLSLGGLLQLSTAASARQPGFSIHQDLLAYPQFEVVLSQDYILEADAQALLDKVEARSTSKSATNQHPYQHASSQTELAHSNDNGHDGSAHNNNDDDDDKPMETYQLMTLPGHPPKPYLCTIPLIAPAPVQNKTATELAKQEEAKELARATSTGLDLMNGLDGSCLYYVLGWWSYTFCYGQSVVQFHAIPGSMKLGPPVRDPQTMEYVLGRVGGRKGQRERIEKEKERMERERERLGKGGGDSTDLAKEEDKGSSGGAAQEESTSPPAVMELGQKGEQRYMAQKLDSGTVCDLTGRDRTIEIQYHCSPAATQDFIGLIKEVTTCAYLMVVYTPRLCKDVAFLPPKETKANVISCRDVIAEDGVGEWKQRKMLEAQDLLTGKGKMGSGGGGGKGGPVTIGGIVVGGHKTFGEEKPRLALPKTKKKTGDVVQRVLQIVAQGSGQDKEFQVLSDEDLAALGIDPKDIDRMHDNMLEWAGENDWKLELVEVEGPGDARALRAVVMNDDENGPKEGGEKKGEKTSGGGKGKEGKEKQQVAQNGQYKGARQKVADDADDEQGSQEEFYKDEL